jgi:Na+/H+ antiporter NhaD/arsenite permease-like protein
MKSAIILFVLMYAFIIFLPKYRMAAALGTAALFMVLGILPVQAVPGAVNWNALMMMCGTMIIVYFFIDSGMPAKIADILLQKSGNVRTVTIFMSLFAGLISAFIDNVATVLIVAPVAIAICKELRISPVPMVLSIAVSSNLQGAATLVGDTTSIMLGTYADMDFLDFFWMRGRPGIFFAVELGAILTVPIMFVLFRNDTEKISHTGQSKVRTPLPTILLLLMIALLIGASFIPDKPETTNGMICMGLAVLMVLIDAVRDRNLDDVGNALRAVDYQTLLLLFGLFLVIEGVTQAGVIDLLAELIAGVGGSSKFILYTVIVWGSVLVSAFIDNIPYVATMLPVLSGIAARTGIEPCLLYFGLLTGATLGGNITPIGASANITGVGILRKEGYEVSFGQFARIGIPFTFVAVMGGYLLIWALWS